MQPSELRERLIKATTIDWEEKSWEGMTPYEFYKNFIDSLAFGYPSRSASIDRLVAYEDFLSDSEWSESERREWAENTGNTEWFLFLSGLTQEQRDLIAMKLLEERRGTIHDVLAQLSYRIDTAGMQLTLNGEPVPTGLEGGMHYDYIGRADTENVWEWPDESFLETM